MEIIGVNVDDKSTEELRHALDTLGINRLSKENLSNIRERIPENIRKYWLDNPDTVGELTEESINAFASAEYDTSDISDKKYGIDESKIYSEEYANIIKELNDKATSELSDVIDSFIMQAEHYDKFYDYINEAVKDKRIDLNDEEIDSIVEQVSENSYDCKRSDYFLNTVKDKVFKTENLNNKKLDDKKLDNGGIFVVTQNKDISEDLGSYLQTKVQDISISIGDELGLPDNNNPLVFFTPTDKDVNSFIVTYSPDIPFNQYDVVYNSIIDSLSSKGIRYDDLNFGNPHELTESELSTMKDKYSRSDDLIDSNSFNVLNKTAKEEIKHAEKVSQHGYDGYGNNEDGFDETGHNEHGEYNSLYDKAYTDQGPDF